MGAGTVSNNAGRILSGFKSKYHQHNSIVWKFIFLAQLLLIAYLTKQLTTVLLGGGASYEEFHNNYCLDNGAPDLNGVTINETVDANCAYDYNFKKVHQHIKSFQPCVYIIASIRSCIFGVMELVMTQQIPYLPTFQITITSLSK